MDPEDLNKDVLKSFPVIFDVEILLKNWPTGQPTIASSKHTDTICMGWHRTIVFKMKCLVDYIILA